MPQQPVSLFSRLRVSSVALVVVGVLVASACSSDSSDIADGSTNTDTGSETETTVDPTAGPVDPLAVEQFGFSLTGAEMTGENTACLLERADGDRTLTAAYSNAAQFTPEMFTALTVAMHACVESEVLANSLLDLAGADETDEVATFSTCITDQLTEPVDGDLTYVGMAALGVGFPVPEGAHDATIDATRSCISGSGVANQFATATEQSSGFTVEIDRACLAASMDDAVLDSFWSSLVRGDGSGPDLAAILDPCSEPYTSGLPTEVPADFVPWAGSGMLAGIDPPARSGVYDAAPPMSIDSNGSYEAVLSTADGEIRVELFADTAPETVNNFVSLARDGYYDGTVFHRVIDEFMAQAGDPTGTGTGGPGYSFDDEESGFESVDRRGLLAMANSGEDTNGSQFFITFAPADHLTGLHVVFGEIVAGDDVLAEIDLLDPQAPTHRGETLIGVEIIEG